MVSRVIGEIKLIIPPMIAVGVVIANILNSLPDGARVILDLAALAILFAGFLILGRLRASADAAQTAADAWRSERDALALRVERHLEEEKALESQISDLRVEISRLEARPTLDSVSSQLEQLKTLMQQTAQAVQGVKDVDGKENGEHTET
jgi:hypothetical protein